MLSTLLIASDRNEYLRQKYYNLFELCFLRIESYLSGHKSIACFNQNRQLHPLLVPPFHFSYTDNPYQIIHIAWRSLSKYVLFIAYDTGGFPSELSVHRFGSIANSNRFPGIRKICYFAVLVFFIIE